MIEKVISDIFLVYFWTQTMGHFVAFTNKIPGLREVEGSNSYIATPASKKAEPIVLTVYPSAPFYVGIPYKIGLYFLDTQYIRT